MVPRRHLLAALAAAPGAAAAPLRSAGQQAAAPAPDARVGVLVAGGPGPGYVAFLRGLADLGYAEGWNLRLEARFAESRFDRLPDLAAELAALRPDAIAAIGAPAARPAARVAAGVPVVFAVVIDPVGAGLVVDPQRPGGNLTGATSFDPAEPGRQVGLLREALPGLARLAILAEAGIAGSLTEATGAAAEAAGLRPLVVELRGAAPDLDAAFAAVAEARAGALLGLTVPAVFAHARRIAEMAAAARLPAMFGPDLADRGPMLAYGTGLAAVTRHAAGMVDRVLRGARPGEMPVETVARPELVVNLRVARAIGVAVPPAVLARADRVVE
jgi:putative ABC transport system substrate-binding protein